MKSISVILLDIEGTVSPISFVHDVLFPYARVRVESFVRQNHSDPVVANACRQIIEEDRAKNGTPLPSTDDQIAQIRDAAWRLMDTDSKTTGLKQLQGLIWDRAFASGEIKAILFDDVAPAIAKWTKNGKRVAIYSSGSIAAQKAFFSHSIAGDMTPLLSGFFDTTTGPKRSAGSYATIAKSLRCEPGEILFLSDVVEEIFAAREAGLQADLVVRPGNAPVSPTAAVQRITTFADAAVGSALAGAAETSTRPSVRISAAHAPASAKADPA